MCHPCTVSGLLIAEGRKLMINCMQLKINLWLDFSCRVHADSVGESLEDEDWEYADEGEDEEVPAWCTGSLYLPG